jgi:hypothetical protein
MWLAYQLNNFTSSHLVTGMHAFVNQRLLGIFPILMPAQKIIPSSEYTIYKLVILQAMWVSFLLIIKKLVVYLLGLKGIKKNLPHPLQLTKPHKNEKMLQSQNIQKLWLMFVSFRLIFLAYSHSNFSDGQLLCDSCDPMSSTCDSSLVCNANTYRCECPPDEVQIGDDCCKCNI